MEGCFCVRVNISADRVSHEGTFSGFGTVAATDEDTVVRVSLW